VKHRGMGCVFPRGGKPDEKGRLRTGSWWIRYYRNGKGYSESADTLVKAQAESLLKKRIGQIGIGEFIPPSDRRITIGELVTDLIKWYRTERNKSRFADDTESRWNLHLKVYFADMRADQLGTDQMRRYRETRIAEKASQVTVNRELQVLRKAYKLAADATPPKVRTIPRFAMAEEDNARKVFMTQEVKQWLRDAAARDIGKKTAKMKGLHLRTFVELLFGLGWRKSELTGLRVENIHLAEGFIRIENSKSGKPREAPLTPTLRVLLEPLVIGKQAHESVFPAKDMRWAWKRLCKEAGVQSGKAAGYVIHDTRRTAARTQRSAGVAESVSSAILGWKPGSKMYARYGIVDRSDMTEALQRSEQWEQEQRTATEQLQSAVPTQAGRPN